MNGRRSGGHAAPVLDPRAARRVFLTLTLTRWFPSGLVVGIIMLWPLERGLSLSQALTAFAFTGFVVFALELPTSGFADAFGRRGVYVAAAVVHMATWVAFLVAESFWTFVLANVLMGVFRALDSGPLEAWYVDTVHATEPGADVDGALAAHGTLLGIGTATASVVSGGLVWWDPLPFGSALLAPFLLAAGLSVIHLVSVLLLMREPHTSVAGSGARRAADSVRQAPGVVRDGLGLLRHNRVLLALVLVEVFWATAMVVYEVLQPVRLAELVGGEETAGALMGPVAAGGWGVFALGATLAGVLSRRYGAARAAMAGRVLNGLGAATMGLVAGPVALVVAYLLTYGTHGTCGPPHATLLHREASSGNRATVLSMNSMVAFGAFTVVTPLLGLLAEHASTQAAMVTAGAVSLAGVLLYLPARRAERRRGEDVAAGEGGGDGLAADGATAG